ncbi:hypothetical protein MtrunA17_Chr3g0125401 [Medicago truncatula]|uniref:Uncharacterized protein n=1 Tax=Medicago truncatula TaxID=3880 RepID=A0A396IVQ6_MEDTR|nr:hypothetical protein MtrunA17_Chr3g0125401 [Medicago truncatula]
MSEGRKNQQYGSTESASSHQQPTNTGDSNSSSNGARMMKGLKPTVLPKRGAVVKRVLGIFTSSTTDGLDS